MSDWFYASAGQQHGPVSLDAMMQAIAGGQIKDGDLVWTEGMLEWQRVQSISMFADVLAGSPSHVAPPPLPVQPLPYYTPPPRTPSIGDDAGVRWLLPVGRSGLAIAAGYAGLFALIPFLAPIAVVLSIFAMVDLKRNPHKHGIGRAIFGLVMGILMSVVLVAMLLRR